MGKNLPKFNHVSDRVNALLAVESPTLQSYVRALEKFHSPKSSREKRKKHKEGSLLLLRFLRFLRLT
jgi:hypothetical protein